MAIKVSIGRENLVTGVSVSSKDDINAVPKAVNLPDGELYVTTDSESSLGHNRGFRPGEGRPAAVIDTKLKIASRFMLWTQNLDDK
jgi:hypothetical protein